MQIILFRTINHLIFLTLVLTVNLMVQPLALAATEAQPSAGAKLNEVKRANRPVKDKWALVIGISKFQDRQINLKYPSKDAKDFYNYLIEDGQFAKNHVILLTDEKATRANILSVIGDTWLPRVANPDDLVVIYISSHGSPADMDVGGVNYLVAHDTKSECLYATGIPLQDLMRIIKRRVHCDRVVIILDACHSGAASADSKGLYRSGNVDASQMVAGTGQLVIASSKPDQISWEGKAYENGVFTRHLIESLKLKGNQTKLGQAFEYMKDKVQQEVLMERGQLQTPELKSQWSGDDLVLSIVPTQPRIGIPIESLELVETSAQVEVNKTLQQVVMPPKTVLNNGNIYKVYNQPTRNTSFTLDGPALLTYIYTYHWNDARGMNPGTISLRHRDGTLYGPWQSAGKPGQGNVRNAYWECEPMAELKGGLYTLIDSHPQSWAQNEGTNGAGFARVKVVPYPSAPGSIVSGQLKRGPVTKVFDNGNIGRVFNQPTAPTAFSINAPVLVTMITNYHWNDGKGQDPGNITLVNLDGTVYGPWRSHGLAGQGSAPNAHWQCSIDVLLKPGLYMVLDSDVNTWSQNRQSGGSGMTTIQGVYQAD
ncbi:MAG: caspase family protein [Candidatus Melainabacteria bacterium]|nr:caspase family protein [Candidatus Melainabacteria bacterium]